jgi:thymidylate synthase (FAD)
MDYSFHGSSLTRIDLEIIRLINSGDKKATINKAIEFGLLAEDGSSHKKSREREELEEKLNFLNISIPW